MTIYQLTKWGWRKFCQAENMQHACHLVRVLQQINPELIFKIQ